VVRYGPVSVIPYECKVSSWSPRRVVRTEFEGAVRTASAGLASGVRRVR
jgi:hypothetical protein